MEEYLNKNSEPIKRFFIETGNLLKDLSAIRQSYRLPFNGEYYLNNEELALRLHVSKRTLQDYRDKGIIPFIALEGKILYKESDIERLLQENYVKAFE